jgi:hypothetical protein
MTAIITSQFRLDMAKKLITDVIASSYYLFIGRSEPWANDASPDTPYDNQYSTHFDAYQKMQSMKLIADADVSYAAVRNQWISGTTYDEYDDQDAALESATRKYFVITDNNNVYICLKSGGASSVSPDIGGIQTSGIIDFTSGANVDGYIWKYLFTLSTDASTKFLTSAFVPVTYLSSNPGSTADTALQNQWDVQQNAVDGAIYNIKVTNSGSGYTTIPTVAIHGDGVSTFAATATISGGVVTGVTISNYGSGFSEANVVISGGGGSGATARVVLGPIGGFGSDPRNDLRAHFVALNSRLVYADGSGDFIIDNDFRQIGIVKDPHLYGTTTVATADTLSTTKSLTVATGGSFALDSEIEGLSSGAKALVDYYDSTNGIIRYHQTEETGFKTFTTADFVRVVGGTGSGQDVTAVNNAEVKKYSGDVIFLENRTPVSRSADQIETIKLVLEL